MDPNANLAEQRRIAARLLALLDSDEWTEGPPTVELCNRVGIDTARLAELVIALDEWLTKGGFLPAAWQK